MQIKNLKINGLKDPIGYRFDELVISYYFEGIPNNDVKATIFDESGNVLYQQIIDPAYNYATDIAFQPQKESKYLLEVSCGAASATACFETGTEFDCPFITPAEENLVHPVIYKKFHCRAAKKARLYITGLGLYVAYLNGSKVGNEYLTPGCNDYRNYLQYQTYDVTDCLQKDNVLEIALGDGWYKGRFGLRHKYNIYGNCYACACKLVVYHDNGDITIIRSDEDFFARPSHTLSSGIYDGEKVDDTVDCSAIFPVKIMERKYNVSERISLPIKVKHKLYPNLIVSPKGEKLLDFGQNFAGFVSFNNFLPNGQTIRLRACEVLENGCFFNGNLRTAKAEFYYVSDGQKKEIAPQFTFYGFRYMLVECEEEVKAEYFCGNVLYSDLEECVQAETDNSKLNRLLLNCVWGQRSNFIDIPTDCPQRDERLGWTGDAEVFCVAACYQMDCRAFYKKYIRDIGIEQKRLGGFVPTYAPGFDECEVATSIWADAVTIIPWTVYNFYGDKSILQEAYPIMKLYVDKIVESDDAHGGKRLYNFGFHLGDWLSQDGVSPTALKAGTNEYFLASCYYYKSVKIVADTAYVLGKEEEHSYYERIATAIRSSILKEYFTVSGRLAIDTQTAYVVCVMFDIYVDRPRLYDSFRKRMKKDCYAIKGGFVGATKLVQALFKSGLNDIAFRILFNEKFPSWLYTVDMGATTIWERWNSLNPDGSLCDPAMNSFNHYSFGAVAETVYRDISGIIPMDIAFKSVKIIPKFNYRLKKFNYKFVSPSGEFSVDYHIEENGSVRYRVKIPYGVRAILVNGEAQTNLEYGVNELEFPEDPMLIHPFSVDSAICDIMANKKTAKVFEEIVPGLFTYLAHNTIGMEGYTIRSLSEISSFHLPDDVLNMLDTKLREIKS